MPQTYSHLTDKVALVAASENDVRIHAIQSGIWVNYDRAKEILTHMEELLGHAPIDRMPNLMIVGPSNNGKTQILRHFLAKHPVNPNPGGDASIIPAVYVEAPPGPDIADLCVRIIVAVGAPYKETSTAYERIRTVKKILEKTGTRLLLIDEIQHMATGSAGKQREFRNAIKDLGNALRISIVTAGVEEAYTVFATDAQLSNRFYTEPLPLWKEGPQLGRLLASIERQLPLRLPSDLKSPQLLQKISFMSEGILGEIYGVLKQAAIQAIKNGTERITLEALDAIRWTKPSKRKERPPLG